MFTVSAASASLSLASTSTVTAEPSSTTATGSSSETASGRSFAPPTVTLTRVKGMLAWLFSVAASRALYEKVSTTRSPVVIWLNSLTLSGSYPTTVVRATEAEASSKSPLATLEALTLVLKVVEESLALISNTPFAGPLVAISRSDRVSCVLISSIRASSTSVISVSFGFVV